MRGVENRWSWFSDFFGLAAAERVHFWGVAGRWGAGFCAGSRWFNCRFPAQGTALINPELAFRREGDQIIYYNGYLPEFTYAVGDWFSFCVFTTQLFPNSTAS